MADVTDIRTERRKAIVAVLEKLNAALSATAPEPEELEFTADAWEGVLRRVPPARIDDCYQRVLDSGKFVHAFALRRAWKAIETEEAAPVDGAAEVPAIAKAKRRSGVRR